MKVPLLMALLSQLSTQNCAKLSGAQWAQVLLLGQTVPYTLKFEKGCDVEGTIPLSRKPFPVDLAVRHIPHATRFKASLTPDLEPKFEEKEVMITLRVESAKLVKKNGEPLMEFSAIYKATRGLDGNEKGLPSCDVHVTRFQGKKVDVHQKIQLH